MVFVCFLVIFITRIIKMITIFITEITIFFENIFIIRINLNLILYYALKCCFWWLEKGPPYPFRRVWGGLSLLTLLTLTVDRRVGRRKGLPPRSRSGCPRPGGTGHHGLGWAPCTILDSFWANLMSVRSQFHPGSAPAPCLSTKGWPSDSQIQGARRCGDSR